MNLTEKRKIEKLVTARAVMEKGRILKEAYEAYVEATKNPSEPNEKAEKLRERLEREIATANRIIAKIGKTSGLINELGWDVDHLRLWSMPETVKLYENTAPMWTLNTLRLPPYSGRHRLPDEGELRQAANQYAHYPAVASSYNEVADKFKIIDEFINETIVLELYLADSADVDTFLSLLKRLSNLTSDE